MKYGLSDKQLQEITGIISSYPQIEHAFIFGSRAINTYKEASDIDIAIKGSEVDSNLAAKLKDYLEEDTYLPFFFDVVAYNSIQSEELKKHIRTKGKAIYSKELEGWREVRLGEICTDISYGYTASAKNEAIGPKFLRITDIVPDRISWKDVPYCEISEKNTTKYKLEIGDIVIARTGATTGYNGIINTNLNCVFASYLIRYRIDPLIAYPFYVGYVLRSLFWKGFVNGVVGGSAQPGANAKQFAGFKFYLPPLPEQKAIAEVLSSLDDKIDLLHRQNKTLEDMAQTLFRKWFIDEADEDWEVVEFGQFINCFNGVSYKSADLNPSTTAMVSLKSFDRDGGFRLDGFKQFTGKYKEQHVVTQGDLVVAHTDITQDAAVIGNPALVVSDPIYEKLVISMDLVKVCSKHTWLSNEFLYRMMRTREFKQHCLGYSNGSTVLHLSKQAIPSYEFFMPPKERILEYTKLAKNLFGKKFENITQVRTLEKLRDTLLPKLMSGEKRVLIDESIQGVY